MEKLKILVVEDNQMNLKEAKEAYSKLDGLEVLYASTFEEAEHLLEKVDAGILDLYFPAEKAGEKMKNLAKKYSAPTLTDPNVSYAGLYPVGFVLADMLIEKGKPAVLVSTIGFGHGGDSNNNFYLLRRAAKEIERKNVELYAFWAASESDSNVGSFINILLKNTQELKVRFTHAYTENVIKFDAVWLAALKAVAAATGKMELYKSIKLNKSIKLKSLSVYRLKDVEEYIATWKYWKRWKYPYYSIFYDRTLESELLDENG